jgi:hypothetical protein
VRDGIFQENNSARISVEFAANPVAFALLPPPDGTTLAAGLIRRQKWCVASYRLTRRAPNN